MLRYRNYPYLLLPVTRGPIHGFYHFFTGYFIPVLAFKIRRPESAVAVVDSTPLNYWFDLLPGKPVAILDSHRALKIAYRARRVGFARGYRVRAFKDWDKQTNFKKKQIARIAEMARAFFADQTNGVRTRTPQILFFGREFTPEYYEKFLPTRYGIAKRNIPNLHEVAEALSADFDLEYVDPAAHTPLEILKKCQHASVLIGQHGAALSNLFFMQPGSSVVEIAWPNLRDSGNLNMFRLLSEEVGVKWSRPILQADKFALVSKDSIRAIILHCIDGNCVPDQSHCR